MQHENEARLLPAAFVLSSIISKRCTTHSVIVHFWVFPGHADVAAHQHEQGKTPESHGALSFCF